MSCLCLRTWIMKRDCYLATEVLRWIGDRGFAEAYRDCPNSVWFIAFLDEIGLSYSAGEVFREMATRWVRSAHRRHPKHEEIDDIASLLRIGELGDPVALSRECERAAYKKVLSSWRDSRCCNPVLSLSLAGRLLTPGRRDHVWVYAKHLLDLAADVGEGDYANKLLLLYLRASFPADQVHISWRDCVAEEERWSHRVY